MSSTEIQIIIITIPVIMYLTIWAWTRRLINSKLTNKIERKKYSTYFNKHFGGFFASIFLLFTLMSVLIFPKENQFVGLDLANLIIRLILLVIQIIYSIVIFPSIKKNIINLKNGDANDILKDIAED